jgi:hypothetical protein
MDQARERARAAVAARKEHDRRSNAKKPRAARTKTDAEDQTPAREVVVRGRTISLPGLRFLDE